MTIATVQHTFSLTTVWEELVYTETRLRSSDLAGDLVALWVDTLARHESIRQGQLDAWRGEIAAQAAIDGLDEELDELVPDLSRCLLMVLKGDRKSPRFRTYFTTPPSQITRFGLKSEIERVRPWVPSLKSEPEEELRELGETFEGVVQRGEAALLTRETAARTRADQRIREIVPFIDDVNALRMTTYGRLLEVAAQNKKSQGWAESFFRRTSRKARQTPVSPE